MATPDIAAIIAGPVKKASDSEAAPMKDAKELPDFSIPKGFTPPDGTKPGEDFDALGTFKINDDGTMCIVAIDGVKLAPESEDDEPDETDDAATPPSADDDGGSFKDAMRAKVASTGMMP